MIVSNINEIRNITKAWNLEGLKIGYVPTMGYLHDGHEALIKQARKNNDKVIVSIFVNPTQFGVNEDLSSYPRDLDSDEALCDKNNVELIFVPDEKEMYPSNYKTYADVNDLSSNLCGLSREGHFKGVCTVLTKFFNIINPTNVYFGKKDIQQFFVVKRLIEDFNFDININLVNTIREEDGLAMSSRNKYLTKAERLNSINLYKSLIKARDFINEKRLNKEIIKSNEVIELMKNYLDSSIDKNIESKLDYLKIVDTNEIKDITEINKDCIIAIANKFGRARLIDNLVYRYDKGEFMI